MDAIFKPLLILHVIAGSLSLITFWIPMFVKKGSDIHIKVGKLYSYLMWTVVISAAILSLIRVSQGHYMIAAFLGFLALLTAIPLWYAIIIIKYKKGEIPDSVLSIRKVLNTVLVISAIGLIIWAILLRLEDMAVLLLIFGIIGLTAIPDVLRSHAKTKAETNWIAEHIEGMVGTGIAAYTAFFAFGGKSMLGWLFTDQLMVIPWVLPTVIGVFIIKRMKRQWKVA